MFRLSPWRLAGLGFVLFSAAGVLASVVCGLVFGLLTGVATYVATIVTLFGAITVATRYAPDAASKAEPWLDEDFIALLNASGEPVVAAEAASAPAAESDAWPARRLSDKITGAFEHACRNGDVKLAEKLLESLELLLLRGPSAVEERALRLEMVIAGRNRLAAMRGDAPATSHRETADGDAATAEPAF